MINSVIKSFRSWFHSTPPLFICLVVFANRFMWSFRFAFSFVFIVILEEIWLRCFSTTFHLQKKYKAYVSTYVSTYLSTYGSLALILICCYLFVTGGEYFTLCISIGCMYSLYNRKYSPFEIMFYRFMIAKILTILF